MDINFKVSSTDQTIAFIQLKDPELIIKIYEGTLVMMLISFHWSIYESSCLLLVLKKLYPSSKRCCLNTHHAGRHCC